MIYMYKICEIYHRFQINSISTHSIPTVCWGHMCRKSKKIKYYLLVKFHQRLKFYIKSCFTEEVQYTKYAVFTK